MTGNKMVTAAFTDTLKEISAVNFVYLPSMK